MIRLLKSKEAVSHNNGTQPLILLTSQQCYFACTLKSLYICTNSIVNIVLAVNLCGYLQPWEQPPQPPGWLTILALGILSLINLRRLP